MKKPKGYLKTVAMSMTILLLLSPLFVATNAFARVDFDDSGVFRHYDTDNSMETSIAYDYTDDEIWKMFYISQYEYDKADLGQLWIYAKTFGDAEETEDFTHHIRVYYDNQPSSGNYKTIAKFKSYEQFDSGAYHWQMFNFDKTDLVPDQWNQIYIADCDSWLYNIIRIGIDQTYGGSPDDPDAGIIEDFDRSFWYSGGASVTPDNPREIQGELMIKMELVDMQRHERFFPQMKEDGYWEDYYPYNGRYIPIDSTDDDVEYSFTLSQADLSNSDYSRLFIYGYSWTSPAGPTGPNAVRALVNGNIVNFDPEVIWSQTRPIGHWGWIYIQNSYLVSGQPGNIIRIEKTSTDWGDHNLAIINFEEVDSDHSAWYFDDGSGYQGSSSFDPSECDGELGMRLLVYKKTESQKEVGGFEMACDRNAGTHAWSQCTPAHWCWTHKVLSMIVDGNGGNNGLEDYGWTDRLYREYDVTNWNVLLRQGYFAGEGFNNNVGGDEVDLFIISPHGEPQAIELPYNDWTAPWGDPENTNEWDLRAIGVNNLVTRDYVEPDAWEGWISGQGFWNGNSQDGFNRDADYVLFFNCYVLRGTYTTVRADPDAMEPVTPWQFLLYHGLQVLMGFYTLQGGTNQDMINFADALVDNWNVLPSETVIDGFTDAVGTTLDDEIWDGTNWWPFNRYIVYYHESNVNAYITPETEVDFDFRYGYEDHSNIDYQIDPDGVTVPP